MCKNDLKAAKNKRNDNKKILEIEQSECGMYGWFFCFSMIFAKALWCLIYLLFFCKKKGLKGYNVWNILLISGNVSSNNYDYASKNTRIRSILKNIKKSKQVNRKNLLYISSYWKFAIFALFSTTVPCPQVLPPSFYKKGFF